MLFGKANPRATNDKDDNICVTVDRNGNEVHPRVHQRVTQADSPYDKCNDQLDKAFGNGLTHVSNCASTTCCVVRVGVFAAVYGALTGIVLVVFSPCFLAECIVPSKDQDQDQN
jgi:hypothetical protein